MKRGQESPIYIRWVKKRTNVRHGGAWKIAYADFVTAMMAFFLLMWLIGSTTKGDLRGIADYFQVPLKLSMSAQPGTGDASSIIASGGEALTSARGDITDGAVDAELKLRNLQRLKVNIEAQERKILEDLARRVDESAGTSELVRQFRDHLMIDLTNDGLRIQIVDTQNRPMFDSASAELKPHTREILRHLAPVLDAVGHAMTITGHTDAAPYGGGETRFGNWELSANRANAARRDLIAGGLAEHKVLRVVGLGSVVLFNKAEPLDPSNRRISIMILTRRAEKEMQRDGV
jgi:chemotaxis protein MotB